MPDPKVRAQLESYLSNPGVSEGVKAKIRARLNETAAESPRFRMEAGPEAAPDQEMRVDIGEARILDDAESAPPSPGGSSSGGSPYDDPAPVSPGRPSAGMPSDGPAPAPPSRADDVLGYLRSGLHGLDRSVAFGAGTALGEMVDRGTRARGEEAAAKYPVSEIIGMVGGALNPASGVAKLGQLGLKAAGGLVKGAGALARMGRGALAGAGGAALQDVGEDVMAGRPVEGAGRAAAVGGALGGAVGGLGAAATGIRRAIRDPMEQRGRDIASAEAIGGNTHWLRGMSKGPTYEAAEEAARKATDAGEVISPAGVAQARAVPELGRAVQGDISTRLGAIGEENAQVGDDLVSLQPMVDKALSRMRGMMRDQKALPGMSVRGLSKAVRDSAKSIDVVDVTDEAVERANPENLLMADEAAAMGLIPKGSDLTNKAVIIQPRWTNPRELEDIRRSFDAAGRVSPTNIRAAGEVANARELAAGARDARAQLGPEAAERAARHERSLGEMENVINASGLPQGTRKVDLGDLATKRQLAGAVGAYRTGANEGAGVDKVLDQLAGTGPLRPALDEAAGVSAIQRLRREGKVPVSKSGIGSYGLGNAMAIRADDVMRYLDNMVGATARPVGRGVIPAAGSAAATRRQQR
jgi:hypothetical protein